MEKFFINNKFTQCNTPRTLKIDVFELPNNKNIGKLFSKDELLFLDQANSKSDPSQILILQFPIPRASLPPSPSLSNFTLANWNHSSTQSLSFLIIFFIGFLILFYPIRPHATTFIEYTKPYANPSQSDLISSYMQVIMLYGSNTLPIKKLSL